MTDGHCFISYSGADALDFATKLSDELQGKQPFINVWFDKRELEPTAEDWDDQLASAISGCKCLIFVMTVDSTAKGSVCKAEWTWALKYKKPVITILLDKKSEVPFRLNNHQHIDFTSSYDTGLARLRTALSRLNSPEGELDQLNQRLIDAQRDLRRARPEDQPRIQADIDELTKQIETQQRIVDDPEGAKREAEQKIQNGLERERQPEKPTAAQTSTKFINPPPGLAPTYFQDRTLETGEAVKFLQDDAQRLMTIVGRGGVGKTAMVCRLLKGLEGGELPDGLGKMRVEGIVYLSESGSHRVNFANLFYDLCKLLPSDAAQELDAAYRNPQGSTESKMRALLEKFGGGRVVALLDNFEPLVDASRETLPIRDAELDEALRAFLNGTHSAVKVVITTRVAPRALNLIQPGRQRGLTLDEGLESPYAENILREMDSDGRLGLKSAGAEALNRARIKTRGFPRALEALFAILASDRYTTLEELLAMPLPENVVEALVGEAFNRLDTNAQKVMQALAVYNRPVTPAAVDYLLAPHIPAMDSAPILQRLANMHFARKESGRFYLHPVDREFAFGLIPERDLTTKDTKVTKENQKDVLEIPPLDLPPLPTSFASSRSSRSWRASRFDAFTQHDLTSRAADYFAQARKPRTEWKKLDDLAAQLAEFDLRCAAGDYDTATSVLSEIGYYLLKWGHYRLTIDFHSRVKDKITDNNLRLSNLHGLGSANKEIGNPHKTIDYCEEGISIAQQNKNKGWESVFLDNLGNAYAALGEMQKSIEVYKQALVIDRERGSKLSEEITLGNLGIRYREIGLTKQAIESEQDALVIARQLDEQDSIDRILENLARAFIDDELFIDAIKAIQESKDIRNTTDIQVGSENNYTLSVAYLFSGEIRKAQESLDIAERYDYPRNNHNVSALHGIIALRQEDASAALLSFTRAIAQADEILAKTPKFYSALDAKGLALCGLAIADNGGQTVDDGQSSTVYRQRAIEAFKQARKIAPHAGVVKSVLRLFDELVKCEGGEILKDVRKAVEGVE